MRGITMSNFDKLKSFDIGQQCRFFQDMDEEPSSKDIIKLWLESETDNE